MHLVVLFILRTQPIQNLDRIFGVGRIHNNRLEAAFERSILFDILAIFVDGGCPNALEFTTGKSRLKDVARIQASFGTARAHNRMEFIDEQNNGTVDTLKFRNESLHAFLELSAVLGTGHHGGHIERHHTLVHQEFRNLLLDNLLSEPLDNRRLTDTRFADERRVVLLAAAKNLDQAFNFTATADNRIEFSLLRKRSQVATEMIQNRSLGAGLATNLLTRIATALIDKASVIAIVGAIRRSLPIHRLSLDLQQSRFKILVGDTKRRKRTRRRRFRLLQNGKHQVFRANVLVAFFFGNLCRIKKGSLATCRKRKERPVGIPHGHNSTVSRQRTLDIFAQFIKVHLKRHQGLGGKSGIFTDKPQQQMFRRYAVAAQVPSRNACRL